jgi:glycosyltransferase involved in cell wall biosynthesis
MSRPLVSVMMPCFNAEATLPLALGSAVAQTLEDWECVCLDDGSSDATWQVLTEASRRDPRFRIERFERNRGRGAARQRLLELVTGEHLAFLDSDDWMYPGRLAGEVRWLEADAKIAAVSACAAITDGPDRLVGVQRPATSESLPVVASFDHPMPPPLLFPTSMIRADLAKRTGFDPAFKRSQDSDFLVRALLGRHFALGSEILAAFSQASAASLEKTLEGYYFRMRAHMKHWSQYPLRVTRTVAETGAKMLAFGAAGTLGVHDRLIERRWSSVVDEDTRRDFAAALAAVRRAAERVSG